MVSTGGKIVIAVIIILLFAAIGWVVFTHLRARRLGLPSPSFSSYFANPFNNSDSSSYAAPRAAPGGIIGWVNDKIRSFKNRNNRSTTGGYEEPLSSNVRGRGATRGFGPLDPDDAWDARVGNEADAYGPYGGYNEEQELGLHTDTGYGGSNLAPTPGQAPAGFGEERGRSRSRDAGPEPYIGGSKKGLDNRYDEEMGLKPGNARASNPFGDDAEASNVSLRGVSPRPIDTSLGATKGQSHEENSPTERRSMFRENM